MEEDVGENLKPVRIHAVLVSHNRILWLKRALVSLLSASQECSHVDVKIYVLINGELNFDLNQLRELTPNISSQLSYLNHCPEKLTPAAARNKVLDWIQSHVDHCLEDWIYFIDDDAYVPSPFFGQFIQTLREFPNVAVIGGPNITPPYSSVFQRACGAMFSSPFATLLFVSRYRGTGKTRLCNEASLILCNLFIKLNCLQEIKFREDLVCAEENWLLHSIAIQGQKSAYDPKLFVWHERRETLLQFIQQIYKYGYGRGQTIRLKPLSARLYHFLPSALVIVLVIAFRYPSIPITLAFYIIAIGVCYHLMKDQKSVSTPEHQNNVQKRRTSLIFISHLLIPLAHISYGIGIFYGIFGISKYRWK